ncbi:hypothetical protein ACNJQJ_22465, partial [Mycobacterium tuberculosis]
MWRPSRWRLTLVFSAAMALVLAAAGAVTVVQFRDAAHEADPDGALRGHIAHANTVAVHPLLGSHVRL